MNGLSLVERVMAKTVKTDTCWLWTGARSTKGYGRVRLPARGRFIFVHRVTYDYFVGPVPDGKELDHICRNRACVRPDHLEAVTHAENVRRGTSWSARNAIKTHCPHGHEYTPENTRMHGGQRHCRPCTYAQRRTTEYRARRMERYWRTGR